MGGELQVPIEPHKEIVAGAREEDRYLVGDVVPALRGAGVLGLKC